MILKRIILGVCLLIVIGVPFALRPAASRNDGTARSLVLVTPHVPQIRSEFALAFANWHRRHYDSIIALDFRTPGGTSEIIKQLQSIYESRAKAHLDELARTRPEQLADPAFNLADVFTTGDIPFDAMFGGGSYDHGRLKDASNVVVFASVFKGKGETTVSIAAPRDTIDPANPPATVLTSVTIAGAHKPMDLRFPLDAVKGGIESLRPLSKGEKSVEATLDLSKAERRFGIPMSTPAGLDPKELATIFGPNEIGAQNLYDPDQYWIGTALSSFGIVYNKEIYTQLGLPEPQSFEDLGRPELIGLVALADPRQSGSITTTLDAILSYYGWEKGWRILREMTANTRYFTNSAPKPPIDVSQGDAAAALAIDFYGRGQAQAILLPGQDPSESRVGYVDPPGSVYIDADPISMLRGAPNPELLRHFIEFCLSEEGQALWQFRSEHDPLGGNNPISSEGVRLGPKEHELRRLPVRRDFYEDTSAYKAAMIDQVDPFALASNTKPKGWRSSIGIMMGAFAIETAREQREAWRALLHARETPRFPKDTLAEMERLFYSFPEHQMPDGSRLPFNEANYRTIRATWNDRSFQTDCATRYTLYFRGAYAKVVELGRKGLAQ